METDPRTPAAVSTPPVTPSSASWLLVIACWCAVALPAAWGVYRTAVNATPLFHAAPATAPAR